MKKIQVIALVTALAAGAVNALAADSSEIDIYFFEDVNNNGEFDYRIDKPYKGFEFTLTSRTDSTRIFTEAVSDWGAAQIEIPAPDEDSEDGWDEEFTVSLPKLPKGAVWEKGGLMDTTDFVTELWTNDGDCTEIFYPYCYSAEVWAFVFEDTDSDGKYTENVDKPMRNTNVYGRSGSMFGCDSGVDGDGYAKLDRGKQGIYTLVIDTPKDGYVYTCTTGNNKTNTITEENLTMIEKSDGSEQFVFIMPPIGYAKSEPTPTPKPTATPTVEPNATPTAEPTATPTAEPTATPTPEPTEKPEVMLYDGTLYLNLDENTVTVIFASYENGRLIGVTSETVSGNGLIQYGKMNSVDKIFIWNSLSGMEPIAMLEI